MGHKRRNRASDTPLEIITGVEDREVDVVFEPDGSLPPDDARQCLEAMIANAFDHCMCALEYGIDPSTGEPRARYFGHMTWPKDRRQWWDSVPPPAEYFSEILRAVVVHAYFGAVVPRRVTLKAVVDGSPVELHVRGLTLDSFVIAWDETVFAAARNVRPPPEPTPE